MTFTTHSTAIDAPLSIANSLNDEHLTQSESRGLLNDYTRATCRSITHSEAKVYVGNNAPSSGILFMGANGQIQFKPDKPRKNKKGEPIKYESVLGSEFDALLPKHPTNKDYWTKENLLKVCYWINDHPYLGITEGAWKAIAGCANGLPTVALLGVEMGLSGKASDVEGKRHLVPTLRMLAEWGFGFIIIFDADAATNPNVRAAERKLAKQLGKFGVPVRSVTGDWATASMIEGGEVKNTKGMDDFIQHKGIEEFRAILAKAKLFEEKDNEDNNEAPKRKPPTPKQTARQLAEDYGHHWKFDNETKTWRIWNGKHWEPTDNGNVETLVKTTIDARGIEYKGFSYIADTIKLLEADLRVKRWQTLERSRYIAFNNLVLDTETGKTLEHSPKMGFTSCLPYVYKPYTAGSTDAIENVKANCPNIHQWMNTAMQGDRKKILKLLAVVNGLLRFRFFDLQMFVHLIGKPGSGKGTFIRLLQKIVGRDNWKGCKLKALDDGSTMASIINKQLVSCPDERNASGVDAILSLTGGDAIGYREVYKQASDAFFYGLLIIGSNHPIFVGDTTGLDRRLCLIHFNNPLSTAQRNSEIEASMDGEISQLIAASLTLTDSEVTEAIQGKGSSQIVEFRLQEWDMKTQTNSVAAHFDDWLILDPTASTPTGKIYDHYKEWCDSGLKAVSHIKYPKMLSELCNDYLELTSVQWEKHRGRSFFKGLRIRGESDTQTPTHSDLLQSGIPKSKNDGVCEANDGVCAGFVRGLEPLPVGNYNGLTGFEPQNFLEKSTSVEVQPEVQPEVQEPNKHFIEDVEKTPQTPSNPANPQPVRNANPAQTPPNPVKPRSSERVSPPAEKRSPREFKVGDKVVVAGPAGIYKGASGEIINVCWSREGQECQVQFDKAVRGSLRTEISARDLMKLPAKD